MESIKMDPIYDFGVQCIKFVQYWFQDFEGYFEKLNHVSDPQYLLDNLFPLVSILDSVFAAQLLIVLAFGGWLNTVMKWWLLEDRPYWWVQETPYYIKNRPYLLQTNQTCVTSPGSPSGRSVAAASVLILFVMWISHVVNDRNWNAWSWKRLIYPLSAFILGSAILARMYIAANFPHQCVLGALLGLFLSPILCIYVMDPFIWQYGNASMSETRVFFSHVISAVATIFASVVTYYNLKLFGFNPHHTVKLALRWCQHPLNIKVSTTPLYSILMWTATLLACSIGVAPDLAEYRYNTTNRFLSISIVLTVGLIYILKRVEQFVVKDGTLQFYMTHFLFNCFRPGLYLRTIPALAMWPYGLFKQQ